MALITLQNISLSYGGPPLLEHIDLQVESGERVCLVGRNGEGKSTLLKLLAGFFSPDDGKIIRQQGLRVADLGQEIPGTLSGPVYDIVADGLGELNTLLTEYHALSSRLAHDHSADLLARFEHAQQAMDTAGGWRIQERVETVLSRLQLPADREFRELSGGLKRRVLLARAMVSEPHLLLLDEPTNHLDIEAINWLEEFLLGFTGTVLFVTHDRMLLRRLATRIIELDRGRLHSWPGDYDKYLQRKEALLDAEAGTQARFDKKLAQEEKWIRQGVKARRTRNEGRVRALMELRQERRARRDQIGRTRMQTQDIALSGKLVVEARNVSFGFDRQMIIRNLSTTIMRGDKIGIIGPNGVGKTTLLRLLLGELKPLEGTIRHGTNLEPAYFDQLRSQLNEDKSVADNVADGNDTVIVNGRPRHIIGYLQDFLFTPDRARSPVKILSGGERNRLLLARLFTKPANILVLDEPTNDLDVETLELLEELFIDYPGTILLVSHDRAFLNNVVTSTLAFENNGRVAEFVGGYDDWLRQRPPQKAPDKQQKKRLPEKPASSPTAGLRKLTFKERLELEELPKKIEALEAEQAELYNNMADPDFYKRKGADVAVTKARIAGLEQELPSLYEKWEKLEALNK